MNEFPTSLERHGDRRHIWMVVWQHRVRQPTFNTRRPVEDQLFYRAFSPHNNIFLPPDFYFISKRPFRRGYSLVITFTENGVLPSCASA